MRYSTVLLLVFAFNFALGQPYSKGFKHLDNQDYDKAHSLFTEIIDEYKTDALAHYGLALCYSNIEFRNYDLFTAYLHIQNSYENSFQLSTKKLNSVKDYVTLQSIKFAFESIDSKLFQYVKKQQSNAIYQRFLSECESSGFYEQVEQFVAKSEVDKAYKNKNTNELKRISNQYKGTTEGNDAYQKLVEIEYSELLYVMTAEKLRTFISAYPDARQSLQAKLLLDSITNASQIIGKQKTNVLYEYTPFGLYKQNKDTANASDISQQTQYLSDIKLYDEYTSYLRKYPYMEGNVESRIKKEDMWVYWYAQNRKQSQGYYVGNKRNGIWTYWLPNGKKWKEAEFRNGQIIGNLKQWDETGHLREFEFRNDEVMFKEQEPSKLMKLSGHISYISALQFTVNSKILVSASFDSTIRIWSVPEWNLLHVIRNKGTYAIAINNEENTLIANTANGLNFYDLKTGNVIRQIAKAHEDQIYAIAVNPVKKQIATSSADRTIKIWNTNTYVEQSVIFTDETETLQFSPDGIWLATGGYDNIVRLWDAETGKLKHAFAGHTDYVGCLSFSPDGQFLASASGDKTIRIWNIKDLKLHAVLKGHTSEIEEVEFSPNGKYLMTTGLKTIYLWNVETKNIYKQFAKQLEWIPSAIFSPNSKYVATGGGYTDPFVHIWDVSSLFPEMNQLTDIEASSSNFVWQQSKMLNNEDETNNFLHVFWDSPQTKEIRDSLQFYKIISLNSPSALKKYQTDHPKSCYVDKVNIKLDSFLFVEVKTMNTFAAYSDFIDKKPNSKYATEAKLLLDSILYRRVVVENTITGFQNYIENNPFSKFKNEAINKRNYLILMSEKNMWTQNVKSADIQQIYYQKWWNDMPEYWKKKFAEQCNISLIPNDNQIKSFIDCPLFIEYWLEKYLKI